MDRHRVVETTEQWRIRVSCTPEEVPYVAASLPKMLAGMTGCYEADIHVHQLPAPQPQQLSFEHRRALEYGRN